MDWYTERLNTLYGLAEAVWPNYYSATDDTVVMSFCSYSERKPDRWTEHEWQKHLFALWHEIETRGLFAVDAEQGTFSYPWEQVEKVPFDLTLPYDAVRPDNMESFAESVAFDCLGGMKHNTQGRKGKVGGNNTPDEENMGLYRRERKEQG
jgi:hypothetical protein